MADLILTVEQRAKLTFVFGAKEGPVSEIRIYSKICDKLDFANEEKVKFGIAQTELATAGRPMTLTNWKENGDTSLHFTMEEITRFKSAINEWRGFTKQDLAWLEPVMGQLSAI